MAQTGGETTARQGAEDRLPSDFHSCLSHLSAQEISNIEQAYQFSARAHAGQLRLSGEPYISHPLQVAKVIAELKLDAAAITAGLLHDVLEDTKVSKREIAARFGSQVADIVDGVSKIENLGSQPKKIRQAESFQKMLLAMVGDLRVILVKLADRLHNMRTLQYKTYQSRRNVAHETLEIYAPIAQRLGIDQVRRELEELGFASLYPLRHRVLTAAVNKNIHRYQKDMEKVCQHISEILKARQIEHDIFYRRKDVYSTYRKMCEKHLSFSQITDILAIRITATSVDDCYRILGLVHNLYRPKPGFFKDYIAIPKPNGYQSLHTVLFGPHGIPLEMQVRTYEMNAVAEHGIAAHVLYKTDGSNITTFASDHIKAREWVQGMIDMQEEDGAEGFMERFKGSLFDDEVYVFTPEGNIITLPRGATALDFAFAVHTDVGMSCTKAIIDKKPCSISQQLRTGQTIEILRSSIIQATPQWLSFVVTPKARVAIRHYLKQLHADAALDLGKNLLNQALEKYHSSLEQLDPSAITQLLAEFEWDKEDRLFREIGLGQQMPALIARRLVGGETIGDATDKPKKRLAIKGTEGMAVTYAKCCYPIPGDAISGMMSLGKGLVIHRNECGNLAASAGGKYERLFLEWSSFRASEIEYQAAIRVIVQHKRGMLAIVVEQIAQLKSNIENITIDNRAGGFATLTFVITVKDRNHLANIMRKIHRFSQSIRIVRVK